MVQSGNPNSVTDAAVGALCARTAVLGAYLNVKINAGGLSDAAYVEKVLAEAAELRARAMEMEESILILANEKIK
jgi:glutamate formiminotransferase/formiminotetrahydrofolate cyclodeaminase